MGGGDQGSFESRFDELFALAIRPAWRLLGNREQAEDVAAEVLARALVRWNTLSASPSLPGWITTVSTNLAIQQWRRARRTALPPGARAEPVPIDDQIMLIEALVTLPRRQRQVIALRFYWDMTEAEIAERLEISLSSVKTHMQRGLVGLRTLLTEAGQTAVDVT